MMPYVSSPFITLCILPFVATLLITAAIGFSVGTLPTIGLDLRQRACIVWVTALVLGMPEFPPPQGNALPVILMAGLILGSLPDQFYQSSTAEPSYGIPSWILPLRSVLLPGTAVNLISGAF